MERIRLAGRECFLLGDPAGDWLLQPTGEAESGFLEEEYEQIRRLVPDGKLCLAAFPVADWNTGLSPWKAPAVFGNEPFGEGGEATLSYLLEALLPALESTYPGERSVYLCGYSLGGLFALWAATKTERFSAVAGVSPSVWFPGWQEYLSGHPIGIPVYLSLGDREAHTRNPLLATVADAILATHERVPGSILEWNPGGHFADVPLRLAKAARWMKLRQ